MADGKGCECYAYGEWECVCGADWTPQEVYDLRAEVERLGNQASLFKIYMEALDRSIFDMSLCRVCGQPVVCLPDGLALCEPCAKRERVEQ